MRTTWIVLLAASILGPAAANAQAVDSCRKCLQDAASTLGSDVATGAVLGAIGGATLGGGLPGAVCGAVIGAAGGMASNVKDVLKCQSICKDEGSARKDTSTGKCDDLGKLEKK
jgi:uncharacterized membrane protein